MIAGSRALAAATWLVAAVACAADRVPVEPYFKHADYQDLKLSPSGKLRGRHRARQRPQRPRRDRPRHPQAREGRRSQRRATSTGSSGSTTSGILFNVSSASRARAACAPARSFTVKPDGSELRVLARPLCAASSSRSPRYTRFLSRLPDAARRPGRSPTTHNPRFYDVYRLDTDTGRKTLRSLEKPGDVVRWIADRKRRAARRRHRGRDRRRQDVLARERIGAVDKCRGIQGARTALRSRRVRRRRLAHRCDASEAATSRRCIDSTPQTKNAGRHARRASAGRPRRRPHLRRPEEARRRASRYDADRPGIAWFDEDWARIAASLDRALPGRFNVLSRSDGPNVLVFSYSDTDPGAYYLFDGERRQLARLVGRQARHQAGQMPTRKLVRYAARDGLEIPAWLTLPRNTEPKNLPLVVYVHGGPWVRGATWAWHDDAGLPRALGLRGAGARVPRQLRLGLEAPSRRLEAVGPRDAGRPRRRHGLAREGGHDRSRSAHASWAGPTAATR